MKVGEWIGLAFLGGGVLLAIAYAASKAKLNDIDPVVLTAAIAMFLGIVILITSNNSNRTER